MCTSLQTKCAVFAHLAEGQFLHVTKIMAEYVTLLIDDGPHGVSKNVGGDFVHLLCVYTNLCVVGCRGCLRSGAEVQFRARGKENFLNQYRYQ